jgi:hypothetical protein
MGAEGPIALATGDLNGDSFLDVVTAHDGIPETISVLIGTGNPANLFAPYKSFDIYPDSGLNVRCLALGDVNGDGRTDVVVGGISAVCILLGSGTGTFGPPTKISISGNSNDVSGLVLRDFNFDGFLDIVGAASGPFGPMYDKGIVVLLGTGGGSFAPPTYVNPPELPMALAVADLNGDVCWDFLSTLQLGAKLAVNLGTGIGCIGPATTYGSGSFELALAVYDLDADGTLDVVTADTGSYYNPLNTLSVFMGTGDGTFGSESLVTVGTFPMDVEIGDFDRDGRADLAASIGAPSAIAILLNATGTSPNVNPYGSGTWGCTGQLGLNANSMPYVGNASFALIGTAAPEGALGLTIVGDTIDAAGSDPFYAGIDLHVLVMGATELYIADAHSGPNGEQYVPLPIPYVPSLAGKAYYAQTLWLEHTSKCSSSPFGFVSSRGLALTIHP